MHVLIIGAGIAGTALALFLRKAGIRASVFEAYPRLDGPGGAFCIAPNGMSVLRELGLADQVTAAGAPMAEFCFRSDRGAVLGRFANGRRRAGRLPAVALPRATLHRILVDALAPAGVEVHCSKRLAAIEARGDRVVARFEDGTEAEGDLLVGADGVWSKTRELLLPDAPKPEFLGVYGVGGFPTLPAGAAGLAPEDASAMHFSVGNGAQFGFCKFDRIQDKWGWWCHLPADQKRDDLRETLLARFQGWHAPIATLIRHTSEILVTAIHTVPPLPRWWQGRVVLVGDAAHAMSPSSGQGASQSLEDVLVLAKLLRRHQGNLAAGLAAYEAERRPRAEGIAKVGVANEVRQNKPLSRLGCWVRNRLMAAVMPLVGASLFEKVYRYESTWDD